MNNKFSGIKNTLPHLAFTDFRAPLEPRIECYSGQMASVLNSLEQCETLEGKNRFWGKLLTLSVNDLTLMACASTPIRITSGDTRAITLFIPLEGEFNTVVDGQEYQWGAQKSALLINARPWVGTFGATSMLAFNLDPCRLAESARAMLQDQHRAGIDLRSDMTRLVPLNVGDIDFDTLFRHLCEQVDLVGMNERLLAQLRFDESIYRYAAMLLYPDHFGLTGHKKEESAPRKLEAVCEFIRNHLGESLPLSRLEEVSGLSRRSLQYAFIRSYDMTPMAWIREQRLIRVRDLLRRAETGVTVKALALRCGFSNLASLAGYYRERFGELPSETLEMSKNTKDRVEFDQKQ